MLMFVGGVLQDAVRKSAVNKTCRKMLLARLSVISSAASAETRRKKERERGKRVHHYYHLE